MKQAMIILIVTTLALLTGTSRAATVQCLGAKCGGSGTVPPFFGGAPWPTTPVDYLYAVTVNVGDHFNIFQVGTDDGNLANYTGIYATSNWIAIGGQAGTLITNPFRLENDHTPPFTPHGNIVGAVPPPGIPGQGSGPDGQCPYVIQWTIPTGTSGQPDTYYFGFDNINEPHDVGGTVGDMTLSAIIWDENWQQPVGAGLGPLHGPVPEPQSAALAALGAGLLCLRRRRKITH